MYCILLVGTSLAADAASSATKFSFAPWSGADLHVTEDGTSAAVSLTTGVPGSSRN
jgi:hypothetical protein